MSGDGIAWYKLKTNSSLIAQVPVAQIKCGVLPDGTPLPAIAVSTVSDNEIATLATGTSGLITERVQVTVYAAQYTQLAPILALIRTALANAHGSVNGVTCDSIMPSGRGPYIFDDVLLVHERSADYMVRWIAT